VPICPSSEGIIGEAGLKLTADNRFSMGASSGS